MNEHQAIAELQEQLAMALREIDRLEAELAALRCREALSSLLSH
jgi:uncharacterized small protein (DUF1192 family)